VVAIHGKVSDGRVGKNATNGGVGTLTIPISGSPGDTLLYRKHSE
jgi:hypothetical protein